MTSPIYTFTRFEYVSEPVGVKSLVFYSRNQDKIKRWEFVGTHRVAQNLGLDKEVGYRCSLQDFSIKYTPNAPYIFQKVADQIEASLNRSPRNTNPT